MKCVQVLRICFLVCLAVFLLGCSSQPQAVKGKVVFNPDELITDENVALQNRIVEFWDAYLHQNRDAMAEFFADDAIRISQRAEGRQVGGDILQTFPQEWSAFERPNGLIAEVMTLRNVELEQNGDYASAFYWVEIEGGALWSYEDLGWVFQAFEQDGSDWKILYQVESWNLDVDMDTLSPGEETFSFDFVYPVEDLDRALAFYTPILGEPEFVTDERASFNMRGAHFWLDTDWLEDYAWLEPPLPGGYAIFYVDDLEAWRDTLIDDDTATFVAGTDRTFLRRGSDRYAIVLDPSQNVFVMMQRNFNASQSGEPQIDGLDGADPLIANTRAVTTAWASTDVETLAGYLTPSTRWLDDTRTRIQGVHQGRAAIGEALESVYWTKYDANANGLLVDLTASDVQVIPFGRGAIVSYAMTLEGTGFHGFRDTAFVTALFSSPTTLDGLFITADNATAAMALELDYTGTPQLDLEEAETFYTEVMELGTPYTDDEWYGYWSNNGVFGLYTADPDVDDLPQEERSNSYISFWVNSAEDTYAYLQEQDVDFPIIPAINERAGVDPNPGYTQVFATDSEGNGVIFTEYTGRPR